MADNVQLNSGSGGQIIRALDDGTTVFPVGVAAFATSVGTPDSVSIVTPTTGLPVRLTDGSDYLSTLPVSAASLPLPTGAATAANQSTANTSLATLAGAVSGTEVQVDVLTMPTVAVTGTFWQATQPVSVASTLTVTGAGGTFPVTDSGGSLTVDNGGTFAVQAAQSGDWAAIGLSGDPDTATFLHNAGTPYLGGTYSRMIQWVGLRDSSGNEPATATTTPGGSDRGLVVRTAGTVSAAQSGAWNITNVSGTVSLPTGAATAAKQPSLGTAGTASSDVLTVQGIASMTPLLVNGSGVTQPVSGTVAATQSGTWTVTGAGGTFPVTDSGGSLTVDAPVGTPVFVRLSDGSSAISTLPVSLASVPSHAVTNAGTFVTQENGAALTALQVIDNPVVVDDAAFTPATTSVMMAGFTFDDVTPDSVNEGDAGAARMSANRCQYVVLRDNAGNERGLNIDASGQLAVTLASAQTLATVTTVSTVTAVSTLTGGGIAHDSADSGNPHKIGGKAKSSLSAITTVAADDRTDLFADVDGVLLVRQDAPLADNVSGVASITNGSSTSVIAAQGSGVKTYITDVTISNTSATAVTVDLRDGTAGSVKWTFPVPANTAGVVHSFRRPLGFSANTAVAADPSASASTITVSLGGFRSKV